MILRVEFLVLILTAAAGYVPADAQDMMSAQQAAATAAEADEVRALYEVNGGVLASCIEVITEESCDSDWVTCREDAWVVKFTAGEQCPSEHDGRLGVVILLDGKTGEIISRFPEIEYFQEADFCRDDFDCLCSEEEGVLQCRNFIQAQAGERPADTEFFPGYCLRGVCAGVKAE